MLNAIIRYSLRYRLAVVFVSLAALIWGGYLSTTLPIDVFPDLDRPRVTVMTECPGMAPEEVETLVTYPLEATLLGSHGVQDVRSQSAAGLSVINVEFDWSTEIRAARQVVKERLDTAATSLPAGLSPQMAPISSIMGQIMIVGLSRRTNVTVRGEDLALRTLADWVVRPRLLKVPGIAQVVTMGGGRKQFQVLVDPAALLDFGVTLSDVEEALKKNNLNASGGVAIEGEVERPIRVLARIGPRPDQVLADLREIPIKATRHRTILLGQVAHVAEGAQFRRGDATVNGEPGVVLTITKQPHIDTRALTDQVTTALKELEAALPADVVITPDLFQMRGFIDRGVANVGEALIIGALLVLIVLFLFLMNFRTTFISLAAIPLSLVLTVLTFKLIGRLSGVELSINVMTLGGIAVAMGELVDDAIVDVENIFRRLRENFALSVPRSALRVIYEASLEVRSAIVFGTVMVILVFLPLFALSGIEGRLFSPLGVAYIVSILMSLVVSLTVTPVLSYYLIANSSAAHQSRDSGLVRVLKWAASYLVRFSMQFAGGLLLLTWIAVGFSAWLLANLGADFLPSFDEGAVQINVTLPSGASVEASNRACSVIDAKLREMRITDANPKAEIRQFVRRTGRAEMDEHAEPPNTSEYILSMNPDSGQSRDAILKKFLTEIKVDAPGVDVEAEQPLAHLMSHMISGVTAQIAIKVYGDDLDVLQSLADRIKAEIGSVSGITPPVIEPLRTIEELHIRLRPDALALYGVDRSTVAEFIQTAIQGEVVSQVLEGQRRFDLLVRLEEPYRTNYAQLGELRLHLPDGRGEVKLGQLADIGPGSGANQVKRDNARRRIVIRCNALGRDLHGVVSDIRSRIAEQVPLPEGYFLEYGGQFESQQRATLLIGVLAAIAGVGMFVVLLLLFQSPRIVLQILNAIPTAFVGGVLALALTHQSLTVASMVGFISLGGIAARNGILLVTHYFHLMRQEGEGFTREMIVRGSLERLSPVLMTALTAGIGLVPLVIGGQQPGREILYPVATVILGGLITSTFCEFLLHPGLFWRFSGRDAVRLVREPDSGDLNEPATEPVRSATLSQGVSS